MTHIRIFLKIEQRRICKYLSVRFLISWIWSFGMIRSSILCWSANWSMIVRWILIWLSARSAFDQSEPNRNSCCWFLPTDVKRICSFRWISPRRCIVSGDRKTRSVCMNVGKVTSLKWSTFKEEKNLQIVLIFFFFSTNQVYALVQSIVLDSMQEKLHWDPHQNTDDFHNWMVLIFDTAHIVAIEMMVHDLLQMYSMKI